MNQRAAPYTNHMELSAASFDIVVERPQAPLNEILNQNLLSNDKEEVSATFYFQTSLARSQNTRLSEAQPG